MSETTAEKISCYQEELYINVLHSVLIQNSVQYQVQAQNNTLRVVFYFYPNLLEVPFLSYKEK